MAEKKEAPAAAAPASKASKAPLILAAVNSLAVLSVLGVVIFTRVIYKRPPITESGERERLAQLHAKPETPAAKVLVTFEPVTVNIEANPAAPKAADGTPEQIQGKLHYCTVGFAIELLDEHSKERLEVLKPIIMDKMLSMLGHKGFHELTTVQGRYVLRAQILDLANQLILKDAPTRDAVVTNVYFTEFIVQ